MKTYKASQCAWRIEVMNTLGLEYTIVKDGSLKVIYGEYSRGEYYEEEYYFDENVLKEDLDSLYDKRKAEEDEKQKQMQIENKKREKEMQKRDKENRLATYLKLKKEFE